MLSQEHLKSVRSYNPETGLFTNLRTGKVVREARTQKGYRRITLFRKQYTTHRLAWLYMTGEWPNGQIDHIDTDKANNCWSNLRIVTGAQNCANVGRRRNNTSGFKGVHWNTARRRWCAAITVNRRQRHLGLFDSAEEAYAAYCAAAHGAVGEFARLA